MNTEAKKLLTMRGTLKSICRVEEYICSLIENGNTSLEEKVIASGKSIDDCWKYITFKAKQEATSCDGGSSACIDDETVFGWSVHFYEDNAAAMEEMKPVKPVTKVEDKTKTEKKSKSKKGAATTEPVITEQTLPLDEPEETASEQISMETAAEDEPTVEPVNDTTTEEAATETETIVEEDVLAEPSVEPVNGEDLKCIICGKTMKDAFDGKPVDKIRKWTSDWMEQYGAVFCCKAHMEEYLANKNSEVK